MWLALDAGPRASAARVTQARATSEQDEDNGKSAQRHRQKRYGKMVPSHDISEMNTLYSDYLGEALSMFR